MTRGIARQYNAFIRRLVIDRWSDSEIASVLGVRLLTVLLARRKIGVPSGAVPGRTEERCHRAKQRQFEESFLPLSTCEPIEASTPYTIAAAREAVVTLHGLLGLVERR